MVWADHLRFLLDLLEPKMDALSQLFEKCQLICSVDFRQVVDRAASS